MEQLSQIWYLSKVAIFIPVLAVAAILYIWYQSKKRLASAWLGAGIVALILALPAGWTSFNLTPAHVEAGLNDPNLNLYLYFSLAGLIVTVIAVIGYSIRQRRYTTDTTGEFSNETWGPAPAQYPATQPEFAFDPVTTSMPVPAYNQEAPVQAEASAQVSYARTEQIDLGTGSHTSYNSNPGGGYAPAKTEILNAPKATVNAWLAVKEGSRPGKLYHLSPGVTTVGRDASDCDIVIDDSAISRQHLKIRFGKDEEDQNQFVLHDLATANGTLVNGSDVARQTLHDGDEIKLGRTILVFRQLVEK